MFWTLQKFVVFFTTKASKMCVGFYAIQFIINNHTESTVNSTKQLQNSKTISC